MKSLLTALLLTLTLLLTACGSQSQTSLITDQNIEARANTEVSISATEGADSYHWKQLSGITVELSDPASPTLRFRAPAVSQEERLLFGLSATFGDVIQTAEVTVIVHPLDGEDSGTEDNTTAEGIDDSNATGDVNDNNTSSVSDDNVTVGSSTDESNTSASTEDNSTTGGTDDNASGGEDTNTTNGGGETNTTTPDTTPPILTLNGESNITLTVGETYTELGATATDERDGSVPVTITGEVNSSQVGTYTLTYRATDRAGNEASVTRTVTIQPAAVTLQNLTLTVNSTSLSKDTNTTLKVEATYSDQTTKDVTDTVQWITSPNDAVKISGHTLTALKDLNVTLQAKLNGKISNAITLDIYWEVNGHRLPPEPDPAVNNATLLGVDVNHNGVRDDVERWIYNKYKDKHPIHIDIAMQAARGYRLVLEKQPKTKEEAKAIMGKVDKAIDCQAYYKYSAKYFNEPILIQKNAVDEYFRSKIYFNTKERTNVYIQYDTLLSGDSYSLPTDAERKKSCDFNTIKYDKE